MLIKKIFFFIFLFFSIPILISAHHTEEKKIYGEYKSKEGPFYISYAKHWDNKKLKELHEELLKNQHGKELHALRKVYIDTYEPKDKNAYYSETKKSIFLLYADRYKRVEDYREILSHEYGHHVQSFYFPSIDETKDTKWFHLREIDGFPVQTGCSCDNKWEHKWYLAEIFADDYVMLFGNTKKLNYKWNDEYLNYVRIKHENTEIPNIMELYELHSYLEEVTGWKINKSRLIEKIHPIGIEEQIENDFFDNTSPYLVMNGKPNYEDEYAVEYYQEIDFYREIAPNTFQWADDDKGFTLRSNDDDFLDEDLSFMARYGYYVKDEPYDKFKGMMVFTYTSIDMRTSLSVVSDPVYVYAKDPFHDFTLLTPEEAGKLTLLPKKK